MNKIIKKFIHKPWECSEEKFKLGRDYPYPRSIRGKNKSFKCIGKIKLNVPVTMFKFFPEPQGHFSFRPTFSLS